MEDWNKLKKVLGDMDIRTMLSPATVLTIMGLIEGTETEESG